MLDIVVIYVYYRWSISQQRLERAERRERREVQVLAILFISIPEVEVIVSHASHPVSCKVMIFWMTTDSELLVIKRVEQPKEWLNT